MQQKEQIKLLGAMCAIDSRTADGAAGTTQVAELLGEQLGEQLGAMGFALEWISPFADEGPRGKHLKAVRNPDAKKRLVLLGHTDTILSPKDVPFRLDAQKGKAYGSGVCDMKGGCLVLVEALKLALAEESAVRDACLVVLLNCCEEIASPSFRKLVRESAKGALACLCFEPSLAGPNGGHAVVIARKGIVRFHLSCLGRAAHAGNDHQIGVNAIRELARKIEQVESLTDYAGGVTANVGRISGGRVSNQVADEAFADFEVRAFDVDAIQRACDAAKKICSEPSVRSAADGTTTRLELHEDRAYPPWPQNSATDALAERYVKLAQKRGLAVTPVRRGGGSDASHAVGLAPALDGLGIFGGGMHSTTEWADIETLPLRTRVAADLIVNLVME
jgi:glutamate carboxypeptidase